MIPNFEGIHDEYIFGRLAFSNDIKDCWEEDNHDIYSNDSQNNYSFNNSFLQSNNLFNTNINEFENMTNGENNISEDSKENIKIYIISKNDNNVIENKLLNKKRNCIFDIIKDTKPKKIKNKLNNVISGITKEETKKKGRKTKNDIGDRKHNKLSGDNSINKIKGYFINHYIIDIIRKNSIYGNLRLKKVGNNFIADLKRDKNLRLYKMKIKDILKGQPISSKYKTYNDDENKKIIDDIYRQKKEIKVINILELTFEELLIIFRKKN